MNTETPSKLQQTIYNTYLKVSAAGAGRPFKYRKRWDNLTDTQLVTLQKLEKFFKKHTDINIETFLNSPYELYQDKANLPLEFYTTLKAINIYKLNKKTS